MAENLELASAATKIETGTSDSRPPARSRLLLGSGIAVLAVTGCLGIYREFAVLWITWTHDPLRSIGMLIPAISIFLTLRAWRQCEWEMRGTWWGLVLISFAYVLSLLRQKVVLLAVFGDASLSFIPISLPVYVYGSGIILLFAGVRVWRNAWFPLGLLLLSQPVPILINGLIDIPLQNISARVARSFATLIHFAPTTPQLRLMFSPDFGMFIAPGCDGIRGAVTMGYVALILGYLKRVFWYVWVAYVFGAILLGYFFNFIRLCVLVLYYRLAIGHPALENMAKQADYAIGSCLFLVATVLFIWVASRKQASPATADSVDVVGTSSFRIQNVWFKCAAFAAVVAAILSLPTSALNIKRSSAPSLKSLAAKMPTQVGGFNLARTWYEQQSGTPVVQAGAYSAPGSDEIVLAVWIAPLTYYHDADACWLARGLKPDSLITQPFQVAGGNSINLSTGFYSDGITDSVVVNAACTPATCSQFQNVTSTGHTGFVFLQPKIGAIAGKEEHPVSIMVRIDRLHTNEAKAATQVLLLAEARQFLAGLNPTGISQSFQ